VAIWAGAYCADGHRFERKLTCLAESASLARRIVLLIVLFAANLVAGFVSPPGTCQYEGETRLEAVYAGSRLGVRLEMTYRMDSRSPKCGFRCPGGESGGVDTLGRAHPRLWRFEKERTWRKDMLTSLAVSASLYCLLRTVTPDAEP